MHRFFKIMLLPLSAWIIGPSAVAAAETGMPESLWLGQELYDRQGRFEGCAISRTFGDVSEVTLMQKPDGGALLILTRYELRPRPEWRGTATLLVDGVRRYTVPAEAMGRGIAMNLSATFGVLAALASGTTVHFLEFHAVAYPLAGLGGGLRDVRDCLDRRRPASGQDQAASTTVAPAPAPAPAPATATAPEIVVELDTYADQAAAVEDWAVLRRKFADVLGTRTPRYERRLRSSDGKVFIAMRLAGFADKAAAERFCRAMKAGKRDCRVIMISPPEKR